MNYMCQRRGAMLQSAMNNRRNSHHRSCMQVQVRSTVYLLYALIPKGITTAKAFPKTRKVPYSTVPFKRTILDRFGTRPWVPHAWLQPKGHSPEAQNGGSFLKSTGRSVDVRTVNVHNQRAQTSGRTVTHYVRPTYMYYS